MAIVVINPDGTVSTIEVDHDAYGNIRPKMPQDIAEETSYTSSPKAKDIISPKVKKKKAVSTAPHKPQVKTVKSTRVVTKQSIDRYFAYIKSHHQQITDKEYTNTLCLMKGEVLESFRKQRQRLTRFSVRFKQC